MKRVTIFLSALLPLFAAVHLAAETLGDKLTADDTLEGVTQSVTVKPQQTPPDQEKLQKLTDTPKKPPLEGVTIKVMDLNVSKNGSVSVDYAPEIKQGELIDSKDQTTIQYKLKF
jgi:hypothetical protein